MPKPTATPDVDPVLAGRFVATALHGNASAVQIMIEQGTPVDVRAKMGSAATAGITALYAATDNDHIDVMKCLLDAGANPNCVMDGRYERTNMPGPASRCALHLAIVNGSDPAIDLLLERGADPRILNDDRDTAAHAILKAVGRHQSPRDREQLRKRLTLMLDRDLPINQRDNNDNTLLGLCIGNSVSIDIVQMLLDRGADQTRVAMLGATGIQVAATYDNLQALDMLIERGADINAPNDLGQTAMFSAREIATCQRLFELGAKIDHVDHYGRTALASKLRFVEASERVGHDIAFLIMAGADLDLADFGGVTPRDIVRDRQMTEVQTMIAAIAGRNAMRETGTARHDGLNR